MARSARRAPLELALLIAALVLAGCDTTRDKNARAELSAKRSLATRKPVVVKKPFAPVAIEQIQAVGRGRSALIVVRLSNSAPGAWAALPINITAGGRLLNKGPNIPYFSNHIPAIGGKARTVWILRPGKRFRGRLRATVGAPDPALSSGKRLPDLRAAGLEQQRNSLIGAVENHSGTPQYSVEIYVTWEKRGRLVGAANGRVTKLTGNGSEEFELPVVGRTRGAEAKISLGPAVLVPTS